ncbi:hypothetical protein ScPMuIL_005472 [Solemya velum]
MISCNLTHFLTGILVFLMTNSVALAYGCPCSSVQGGTTGTASQAVFHYNCSAYFRTERKLGLSMCDVTDNKTLYGDSIVCNDPVCLQVVLARDGAPPEPNSSTLMYNCTLLNSQTTPEPLTVIRRCHATNMSIEDPLLCVLTGVDCGQPPVIDNTMVNVTDTKVGGLAIYSCNITSSHYTSTSVCQIDGMWTDSNMQCEDGACRVDQYTCPDGECIPAVWHCDGIVDCSDGQDEDCGSTPPGCASDEYTCSDGQCIPDYWFCDSIVDCSDGDDENWAQCGCPDIMANAEVQYSERDTGSMASYWCIDGYFSETEKVERTCKSDGSWSTETMTCIGACEEPSPIANAYVNVGSNDIGSTRTLTCNDDKAIYGEDTITCLPTGVWSEATFQCFGVYNVALMRIATMSTELGYGAYPSDHSAMLAVDGVLTNKHPRCAHTDKTDPDPWWSVDLGQNAVILSIRLLNRDICDKRLGNLRITVGQPEDMKECAYFQGPGAAGVFTDIDCAEPLFGRYITIQGGMADTNNCENIVFVQLCEVQAIGFYPDPIPCTVYEFQCPSLLCIDNSKICDTVNDCGDGTDEQFCEGLVCFDGEGFLCPDGGCIPPGWICDGIENCYAGADEECEEQGCWWDEYTCSDGECIPDVWRCDGMSDCSDGLDETGCGGPGCLSMVASDEGLGADVAADEVATLAQLLSGQVLCPHPEAEAVPPVVSPGVSTGWYDKQCSSVTPDSAGLSLHGI